MRTGQGYRTVKGRTVAQRDHAADYGSAPDSVLVIRPADAGLPTRSWWLEAKTREEFDAAAQREQARISESKFAQIGSLQLHRD